MRNKPAKKKPSSRTTGKSDDRSLPAPVPEPRWVSLLWWPAVILTCWSFGFTTMQGSDLWWHLAGGRWITQTHTLHFTDPFSFTCHGRPWFHPEWLSDVIFYNWSRVFGTAALVWWKWGLLLATFALLFRLLRQICGGSGSAYLAVLAAIAVGAPFFDMRPQLYTFLGFVVVLSFALPLSRKLWILPLVFMLWANLHSGFILGLVTIATVLAISFFYREAPRRAVYLGLACLLACFVNGNGSEALFWPIRFAQDSHSPFLRIAEWLPPWEPGGIRSKLYYPSIAAFVVSLFVVMGSGAYRRQPRLTLSSVAIGLVTLVLSMRSRRFIPLFGISQSLLMAPALVAFPRLCRLVVRILLWLDRSVGQIVLLVVAVALGGILLARHPLSRNAFLAGFVVSLLIVVGSRAYRRQPLALSSVAIGLVTLVLSITTRRFIPLLGISQSFLLAPALVVVYRCQCWLEVRFLLWLDVRFLPWLDRQRVWQIALPVAAMVWGGLQLAPFPLSRNAFLFLTAEDAFPVEAMNLVETNHLEGNLFGYYNWGGYVDWRTGGRLQVFIDGRAGTAFDEKTYRQYLRVLGLQDGWDDVVWASGADFVLWPQHSPQQIEQLRKSGRWRFLYSDHVAALLARADRPPPQPLLPTPDSPWRDLTLGWAAFRTHEYATAQGHFQRALQRMPNLRPACEWLADAHSMLGRLAEAEATVERCQRIFPDSPRRKQLLQIFRARGAGGPTP